MAGMGFFSWLKKGWTGGSSQTTEYTFRIENDGGVSSLMDMRNINWHSPAGIYGGLRVNGEEFEFEDGTPFRLWGINVTKNACAPPKSEADKISQRIAKLGFNCVRFHLFDTFQALYGSSVNTTQVDRDWRDRWDYFMFKLKENGVYWNINLRTWRGYKEDDPVPCNGLRPPKGSWINFIHPDVIAFDKALAKEMLEHINPYTGKKILNDPALAAIEITNENSIYGSWTSGIFDDDPFPATNVKAEFTVDDTSSLGNRHINIAGIHGINSGANQTPNCLDRYADVLDVSGGAYYHIKIYNSSWTSTLAGITDAALLGIKRAKENGMKLRLTFHTWSLESPVTDYTPYVNSRAQWIANVTNLVDEIGASKTLDLSPYGTEYYMGYDVDSFGIENEPDLGWLENGGEISAWSDFYAFMMSQLRTELPYEPKLGAVGYSGLSQWQWWQSDFAALAEAEVEPDEFSFHTYRQTPTNLERWDIEAQIRADLDSAFGISVSSPDKFTIMQDEFNITVNPEAGPWHEDMDNYKNGAHLASWDIAHANRNVPGMFFFLHDKNHAQYEENFSGRSMGLWSTFGAPKPAWFAKTLLSEATKDFDIYEVSRTGDDVDSYWNASCLVSKDDVSGDIHVMLVNNPPRDVAEYVTVLMTWENYGAPFGQFAIAMGRGAEIYIYGSSSSDDDTLKALTDDIYSAYLDDEDHPVEFVGTVKEGQQVIYDDLLEYLELERLDQTPNGWIEQYPNYTASFTVSYDAYAASSWARGNLTTFSVYFSGNEGWAPQYAKSEYIIDSSDNVLTNKAEFLPGGTYATMLADPLYDDLRGSNDERRRYRDLDQKEFAVYNYEYSKPLPKDDQQASIDTLNNRLVITMKPWSTYYAVISNDDPGTGLDGNDAGTGACTAYIESLNLQFNDWLISEYTDDSGLDAAWGGSQTSQPYGRLATESLTNKTVARLRVQEIQFVTTARANDMMRFLTALQENVFSGWMTFLAGIGVKCPITGTQLAMFTPHVKSFTPTDFVDSHIYWDHVFPYGGDRENLVMKNFNLPWTAYPCFPWESPGTAKTIGPINQIGSARHQGKPFVISEWLASLPNDFNHDFTPIWAAFISHQGISGAYAFTYTKTPEGYGFENIPGHLTFGNHPTLLTQMFAGGLAYRRGDVDVETDELILYSPDSSTFDVSLITDEDTRTYHRTDVPHWAGLLARIKRVFTEGTDSGRTDLLGAEDPLLYTPSSGQIIWDVRNRDAAVVKIDSPRYQVISGEIKGSSTTNLQVTGGSVHGSITAVSLTDDSLSTTERLLLVIGGQTKGQGETYTPVGAGWNLWDPGSVPLVIKKLNATVELRNLTSPRSFTCYKLDKDGNRNGSVGYEYKSGKILIDLKDHDTPWFELIR